MLRLCLILVLMATIPAQARDPLRHGGALARQFCERCHAVGVKGESSRQGAIPLRRLGQSYDLDALPRQLVRGISAAHAAMPELRFRPQDARDLRDYLRSIQE